MRSRTFLNVSLGILALAAAYHLGASRAGAQGAVPPVAAYGLASSHIVVTSNGDVWRASDNGIGRPVMPYSFEGNVFAGGATPATTQESFGSLKVRYRGERETQGVKPSTNR